MTSETQSSKSDKAFKTIREVADLLGLEQHVLRFWETKFKDVKPVKRAGGRRYYRPEDVEALKTIQQLLHGHKLTIKGAQQLLNKRQKKSFTEVLAIVGADGEVVDPVSEKSFSAIAQVTLSHELVAFRDLSSKLRQFARDLS